MKTLLLIITFLMVSTVVAVAGEVHTTIKMQWDTALAGLFSVAGHAFGHLGEADNQGVHGELDAFKLVERYSNMRDKASAHIYGAGFIYQDRLASAFDQTPMGAKFRFVNAVYKIAYLSDLPRNLSSDIRSGGDLGRLDDVKGHNVGRVAVGVTAVNDLVHAYLGHETKWDVAFWQSREGTPGLQFTWRE